MRKITAAEAMEFAHKLQIAIERRGYKSQISICKYVEIHQSQLSKILSGEFRCVSKNVQKLFKYFEIDYSNLNNLPARVRRPAKRNEPQIEILQAFEVVWDGTLGHATAIRDLILATQNLTRLAGATSVFRGE